MSIQEVKDNQENEYEGYNTNTVKRQHVITDESSKSDILTST